MIAKTLWIVVCLAALPVMAEPSLDELLGIDDVPKSSNDASPTPEGTDQDASPESNSDSNQAVPAEANTSETSRDPLEVTASYMDDVATRLDQSHDSGLGTQRVQEDILERLDQLIAQAIENSENESSSSSSGSGGGESKPSNGDAKPSGEPELPSNADAAGSKPGSSKAPNAGPEVGINSNTGRRSPGQVQAVEPGTGPLREIRTEWGTLPPRLRDELSNGLDEAFSPLYRRETEAFYRRLAEEAAQ